MLKLTLIIIKNGHWPFNIIAYKNMQNKITLTALFPIWGAFCRAPSKNTFFML